MADTRLDRLEAEIETLRAEVRTARRRQRRSLAVAGLAVLGLAALGAKAGPSIVRAERFELVDASGALRGVLTSSDGGTYLQLEDELGGRSLLEVQGGVAALALDNPEPRFTLPSLAQETRGDDGERRALGPNVRTWRQPKAPEMISFLRWIPVDRPEHAAPTRGALDVSEREAPVSAGVSVRIPPDAQFTGAFLYCNESEARYRLHFVDGVAEAPDVPPGVECHVSFLGVGAPPRARVFGGEEVICDFPARGGTCTARLVEAPPEPADEAPSDEPSE